MSRVECPHCEDGFGSERALKAHSAAMHPKKSPWHDEKKLREEYWGNEKSAGQMADEWGCCQRTVLNWMEKHSIPRREMREVAGNYKKAYPAPFRTNPSSGYEVWNPTINGKQYTVSVHRLAAVAWFGFDAVGEKHVHHDTPVPWLNTEWNLQPIDPSEHISQHMQSRVHKMVFDENGDISGWER